MFVDVVARVAAGGVAGSIAGSFLATLAIRWERGQSIARGRSCCDACGTSLAALDLLPLVGFVLARGRCRHCGAAIDRRHPLIEGACSLVGGIALGHLPGLAGWAGAVFGWLLVVLGAMDAACFWLPDPLTGSLALAGLAAGAAQAGPPPLAARGLGIIAGFTALSALRFAYLRVRGRDGLGGGDAKLFGAIGAWLGWEPLPLVALIAAVAGLAWTGVRGLRGQRITRYDRLPLGTLLAGAAWAQWLLGSS